MAFLGLLIVAVPHSFGSESKTIYKWRDEQGRLHISDKPPPEKYRNKQEQKQIKTTPSQSTQQPLTAQQRLSLQKRQLDAMLRREALARQEKQDSEKRKAEKKRQCEYVRKQQLVLQSRGVVYLEDKSGKRKYLNDEERVQEIEKLQQYLQQHCVKQ
jgi:vacuolar-type H+-ATPase subunit I/STV1